MFDVITFGSATKDIFLSVKESLVTQGEEFATGEGVCFSLGSKINAEKMYFTSGGGGTNTAVTLAKQGLVVAYCGKVGNDGVGKNILKDLQDYGVDTRLVSLTKEKFTNHSVVLDVPGKDRTIFVYRGASDLFTEEDVSFTDLRASWFYLAPFSRSSVPLFHRLIENAVSRNIKLMVNPSKIQLKNKNFKNILSDVSVLLLNMEEASLLTGLSYEKKDEIVEKLADLVKDVVLITQGVDGVVGHSKGVYYRGKPVYPDAVDRTGAGDSFGSGFLSEFIRTGDVKKGIQFGIANSTACLQKQGAKHGLLKKGESYPQNPVIMGSDLRSLKW